MASIGNKLTGLVFAIVLATLVLVGGAFWWTMGSFHEAQTREKLTDATHSLQFELRLVHSALEETARRLSHQSDVVSSVNLIHAYEDPANYQPLVFDTEKRKLAQRLNQVSISGNFDLIATYTPGGRITAFSSRHGNQMTPGFQSYTKDGDKRFLMVSDTELSTNPMLQFVPPSLLFLSETGPAVRAGRIITQTVQHGLMLDIITPILRTRSNDEVQNLGWLRVVRVLNDGFFSNLGTHAGVRITFAPPEQRAQLEQRFGGSIPSLGLNIDSPPAFALNENSAEFVGAVLLQDAEAGASVITLSILKAEMIAGLTAFRDSAIVVLLLASLIFLPAMLFFVRANISRPLNALVSSAVHVANGQRVSPEGTDRNDEIGALAKAFADMATTVQAREHELHE